MNTKIIGVSMDYNKVQPLGETYTCLQGEGKYIGIPHILIRVTGCRLRCQFSNSFCDFTCYYLHWLLVHAIVTNKVSARFS